MGVTLVNGSVLLPNPADWSTPPSWKRAWHTGISAGITGGEGRQQMRALPRESLSWTVGVLSLEERAAFDAVLDAASQSGLACAPYWGRGMSIQNAVGAGAGRAFLADMSWDWQPGDYAFFADLAGNYDVVQLIAISRGIIVPPTADQTTKTADETADTADESVVQGETADLTGVTADSADVTADATYGDVESFTFAPNLAHAYPAGALVWPMMFGKFTMQKQSGVTAWHADVRLTIDELAARHQAAIGTVPGGGVGIGAWSVGSTFRVN